jgi:hypothetical protein
MSSKKEINTKLIELFEIFKKLITNDDDDEKEKLKKQITKKLYELKDFLQKLDNGNGKSFEYEGDDIKEFKDDFYDFLGSTPKNPNSADLKKNPYKRFYNFIHTVSNLFKKKEFQDFFNYQKDVLNRNKNKLDKLYENLFAKFLKKFNELIKEEEYKKWRNMMPKFVEKMDEKTFKKMSKPTKKEQEIILEIFKSDKKKEVFQKDFQNEFQSSQKRIDVDVKDFEDLLTKAIGNNKDKLIDDFEGYTAEYLLDYLNHYFNEYLDNLNQLIKSKSNENEIIKLLADFFKLKIEVSSSKKPFDEDLDEKYKEAENDLSNIDDLNEEQKLKKVQEYSKLFDTDKGDWKTDSSKKASIKDLKKNYDKLQGEKIEISEDFPELQGLLKTINTVKTKLEKGEKITKKEQNTITNFNQYIDILKKKPQYSSNDDYKNQLENIIDLHNNLKIGEGEDQKTLINKVKEEEAKKRITKDVISKEDKDEDTIYFDDYISIFRIFLKFFTYGAILFVFIVLFVSILSVLILTYDIIVFIIKLFVNPKTFIRSDAIDYMAKSIIKCSKDNYKDDRYLILNEQKQNLTIFNLGAYTIYLLVIYLLLYFILIFYAKIYKYKFEGSLYDIDEHFIYLFMIGLLLTYSFIHLLIFKLLYKPFVYVPFFNVDKQEKEVDEEIDKNISINDEKSGIRLSNDNFFELLFDASKIDKLNDDLLKDIKSKDASNCLRQKIIIYNLYQYLRQYINFDDEFKNKFKILCIRKYDDVKNRTYKKDNKEYQITFLSMLNYNEVKIINNFHEDLNLVNLLNDEDIEFYNKINTETTKIINGINKKIITHNKTSLPFFITIFYLFLIFILNFIIIFFVIRIILSDTTDSYHDYFKTASSYIMKGIYLPLISFFLYNKK